MARRDLTQNQKAVVLAKANKLQFAISADHRGAKAQSCKLHDLKHGDIAEKARVAGIDRSRISEALTILRYAPGLADDVLAKKLRLDEAVIEARRLRPRKK